MTDIETMHDRLTRAYEALVGSSPDGAGQDVIAALIADTEGDETAISTWIGILAEAYPD